jgi:FixJ family two-component response regulator
MRSMLGSSAIVLAGKRRRLLPKLQRSYNFLTPSEREVLALVVAGRPNKQIAAQLELVTVKVHRSQISRKMRARPLVDLGEWLMPAGYAEHATNSAPGAYM